MIDKSIDLSDKVENPILVNPIPSIDLTLSFQKALREYIMALPQERKSQDIHYLIKVSDNSFDTYPIDAKRRYRAIKICGLNARQVSFADIFSAKNGAKVVSVRSFEGNNHSYEGFLRYVIELQNTEKEVKCFIDYFEQQT